MNKQEKLFEVVHAFSGKWPHPECVYMGEFLSNKTFSTNNYGDDRICTKTDFYAAARELGYVNGYRWGVEYPTNGKKPDLPDDVVVEAESPKFKIGELTPSKLSSWNWSFCIKFKITDTRYKPADTSYLDKADNSIDSDSSSLDNGGNYNEGAEHFEWIANQFDNVDDANVVWGLRDKLFHKRKAEAERKRVVDAAYGVAGSKGWLKLLYDNGFLRMPEDK
jgi:hypothetical protein